ncbi:LysR family transcriptional regulator substrate-binding protein [Virgisporangium aurantiacum]|uniref:LysR family transcriptional regulator substrate-binding protein n=1 Tax=Virgisporangium aurantiacum TaxID=175570 RepID=UPI001EF20BEA|nr:LysR family transcriptional regulator substrate-binding protein [Virgisporangium aurantiacum]
MEFRLVIVPGVTVDKWTRMWADRVPSVNLHVVPTAAADAAALLSTDADAGLLRLPVDRDTFHAVPLYTETTVVVAPRGHLVSAADEVTMADLADDTLLRPLDDVLPWPDAPLGERPAGERPADTAAAVALVAAEAGVLVVPQSLARAHQRRDVTHRVVTDAPTSSVGLVWPRERYTDLVEEMIGIVRGRTANSTRGRAPAPAARTPKRRGRR